MPITIQDYMKTVAGDKELHPAFAYLRHGVQILGSCEYCGVILFAHIAYPAKSGQWRCAGCIDDNGFSTVEEFQETLAGTGITCPRCGEATDIHEVQVTNERTEALEYVFECGECGLWWP